MIKKITFLLLLSSIVSFGQVEPYLEHTIDTNFNKAVTVSSGDIDIIASNQPALSDADQEQLVWYENNGNEIFTKNIISSNEGYVHQTKIVDFDNDGDFDILYMSRTERKFGWFENDGNQNFTKSVLIDDIDGDDFPIIDLDGDNDLDIIARSSLNPSDTLAWYENNGDFTFTKYAIESSFSSLTIKAIDFDKDGDFDILKTNNQPNNIEWFENDGSQNFTKKTIPVNTFTSNFLKIGDLDADLDLDLINVERDFSTSQDHIVWYENDGNMTFSRHLIVSVGFNPEGLSRNMYVYKINKDDFLDIFVPRTRGVDWYINDGNQNFTKSYLSFQDGTTYNGSSSNNSISDIDQDGLMDVIIAIWTGVNNIIWFENILDPVIEPEPLGKCYDGFENRNWISNCSFDLQGRLTSSGVSYFNSLGKAIQNQTTDIKTGRIWASQTIYDYHGRSSFQSLSAPIDSINYGYKNFVLKANGANLTTADVDYITEDNLVLPIISNQENTLGWYYSENNTREPYQDITANPYSKSVYSNLNPGTVLKTLGGNKVTIDGQEKWLNGYSFTMPVAQELFYAFGKDAFPQRESLESTNGGQNFTGNAYCVISPVNSSTEYLVKVTSLNVASLELNAIYKFTLTNNLSGIYELLSVIYENDLFDDLQDCLDLQDEQAEAACEDAILAQLDALEAQQVAIGQVEGYAGTPYYIKATKTVSRDVHGIENVIFTDADGNTLAAARSGNEENTSLPDYEVVSTIGEQGFVDIHIPVGTDGIITFEGMAGMKFRVYDLISENLITPLNNEIPVGGNHTLPPGMYRIEEITNTMHMESYVTIDNGTITLLNSDMAAAVRYKVNYYDYSLNYYDKANRLVKSVQPLGFDNTNLANDTFNTPNHNYISTFDYNTLGQLQESTSPDEGSAQFKYRKDGQIRFSQNSKQVNANEFSFTNYDNLGRPIESGVLEGTAFASTDSDNSDFKDQCNEVIYPMGFAALLSSAVSQHLDNYFVDNYNELIELNDIINGNVASQIDFDFPFSVNLASGSVTVTDITQFRQIIQNAINTCTFFNKKEQHFTKYDQASLFGLHVALIEENIPINDFYEQQQFIAGNVVKTFTQNPNTTTTWYSYDVYGRVQWLVQKIDGLGTKTIDYEYDQTTGEVTKVCYQKNVPSEMFIHQYKYSIAGQLAKVATSTDNINFTNQAKYYYYETGALKRTELADNLQGIDYTYNLAGQLKAINHPSEDASLDPGKDGTNDFPADMFGAGLDYYSGDYQRINTPTAIASFTEGIDQFNGNIKSISWKTNNPNTPTAAAYNYSYNKNNWLASANFTADIGGGGTTEANITKNNILTINENVIASESISLLPGFHAPAGIEFTAVITPTTDPPGTNDGDYNVSNLSYDVNGNILSLNRNKHTENGSNKMDQLSYDYKEKKNQLDHVNDAVTETTNANDIKTQSAGNYTYNEIGQLESNTEEGISYTYNASGLVTEVQKNNQPLVKFYYNDKGYRVRKESFNNGILTDTDYYIRDFAGTVIAIYKNGMLTEVPIHGASHLGIHFKESGTNVYQLTDHLGNVRAVIAKIDNDVAISNSTDYYPFGMPMPNRFLSDGNYRYAFQSQEKDQETGKEAFELRFWDSRIARWLSPDPYNAGASPYWGMDNNPIISIDPDGGCPNPPCWEDEDTFNAGSLGEVVIVARGSGQMTSELNSQYDFGGTYAQWQKRYGYEGIDYNNARLLWESQDNGAWDAQVAKLDRDGRNQVLLGKLQFFTAYFEAIEDVSEVLPGNAAVNTTRSAIRTFKYIPRYQVKVNIKIHGNSLDSPKSTWFYKLYNVDGTFLKNGITSNIIPETRYTKSFMADKFMKTKTLFPNRRLAYEFEYLQNVIEPGPLNLNMH